MRKVFSSKELYIPVRQDDTRYIVSYDYHVNDDNVNATWFEVDINKRQKNIIDFKDVKNAILADIDSQTDEAILTGYTWNDMQVWLSLENQFNYKAAFDLAVQTSGAELPVKFKFGTPDEPIYYTFTKLSELQNFYVGAKTFINQTLDAGWQRKDSIDWSLYADALSSES